MTKFFEKYPGVKLVFFIVSCAGVYGGAVNYGGFDFIPAIPFLAFVVYVAVKWKKLYRTMTLILFFICVPLYILKQQHGILFHPALEKEFMFKQDICLEVYEKAAFARPYEPKNPCVPDQFIKANTLIKVSRISVSNADLGEKYVIHAQTKSGELYYSGSHDHIAVWSDGKVIQQDDLRRKIFYIPSLIMYWPIAPLAVPTLLKMNNY